MWLNSESTQRCQTKIVVRFAASKRREFRIRIVIGQVDLEQFEVLVDFLHQTQALGQRGGMPPSPPQTRALVRSVTS